MMPFGVGRRICPGLGLAVLQSEHLVANLVREFVCMPVEVEVVDLTEMVEVMVLMKKNLASSNCSAEGEQDEDDCDMTNVTCDYFLYLLVVSTRHSCLRCVWEKKKKKGSKVLVTVALLLSNGDGYRKLFCIQIF